MQPSDASVTFPPHITTPSPLPISSASKEMFQQQRKSAKKKLSPLTRQSSLPQRSDEQLFSLHKDVGQHNSQLFEPQTPEFKPSPEWVGVFVTV